MSDKPTGFYAEADDDAEAQLRALVVALFNYILTFAIGYKLLKRRMRSGKGGHDAALFGIAWLAARQSAQFAMLKREIKELKDDG